MTLWQRMKMAWRVIRADAVSDLRHPTAWLLDWAGASTTAGLTVTPHGAMALAAYYACLRAISEDVAKLPLFVYRRLTPRGKERAPDHPLYRLLHTQPNPDMGSMTFRETLTHHMLGWGNGYAEIIRNGRGEPIALLPIHPSRVTVRRDEFDRLVYDVWGAEIITGTRQAQAVRLRAENILHVHGLGPEGLTGYSVAHLAAESLGLSMAAQTFGATFFGNNTVIGGVLEHPQALSEEAQTRLRQSWQERYQGPHHAHKPVVLEEGMKWSPFGIPPEQAQFLETRAFQVREIARWFRMPPHKIQDLEQATFSNIEHQALEYVTDTLMPWLVRWEQELLRKLLPDDEEFFIEHLILGLLRGDQQARAQYYTARFKIGTLSPNDIRELENENPIGAAGDQYFIEGNNLVPLPEVGSEDEAETAMPFPLPSNNGTPRR